MFHSSVFLEMQEKGNHDSEESGSSKYYKLIEAPPFIEHIFEARWKTSTVFKYEKLKSFYDSFNLQRKSLSNNLFYKIFPMKTLALYHSVLEFW